MLLHGVAFIFLPMKSVSYHALFVVNDLKCAILNKYFFFMKEILANILKK